MFDDIRGGFAFFHGYKEWLGCQAYASIKQLYREPYYMKWGKPSIWCCNTDPRLDPYTDKDRPDWDWIESNCDFIEVTESLVVNEEEAIRITSRASRA